MKKLPVYLPGGCVSGGMTPQQSAELAHALVQGRVKVLFVSPERLGTHSFK